jgi:hypothetical protein
MSEEDIPQGGISYKDAMEMIDPNKCKAPIGLGNRPDVFEEIGYEPPFPDLHEGGIDVRTQEVKLFSGIPGHNGSW